MGFICGNIDKWDQAVGHAIPLDLNLHQNPSVIFIEWRGPQYFGQMGRRTAGWKKGVNSDNAKNVYTYTYSR